MSRKKDFKVFTHYLDLWGARVLLFVGPWESFKEYSKQRLHIEAPDEPDIVNCAGLTLRALTEKGIRKGYCIYMPSMEFTI